MKTKFYRVCRSGLTIDGREVTPAQIDQMAESYNPQTYGARVWCEHLRSMMPTDTPFRAYGDVLAVKAETDAEGYRVLLAQIDATDDLVKLNGQRQKVFWSVEIDPNFAGTGKAYLCGLAVTDTPASLGTEILKLSHIHRGQMPGGDKMPNRLYSQAIDAPMEPEASTPASEGPSLLTQIKNILRGEKTGDDARFRQLEESVTVLAGGLSEIKTAITTLAAAAGTTKPPEPVQLEPMPDTPVTRAEMNALIEMLNGTPAHGARPPHDGSAGGAANITDC